MTRFSPDGNYLAVSGKSADIVIYDTKRGDIVSKIDGKGFSSFSFSPDSKFAIAQNSTDMAMQIAEVQTGKQVREIRGTGKLSNLNKILGGSGIINEVNGVFPIAVMEMGNIPVTRDWKSILVNKNDKEFSIFDFQTGDLKYDLNHANFNSGWESAKLALALLGVMGGTTAGLLLLGSISNTQFSENGKYLLIANGNKKPTLWNIETGSLIAKFDAGERVFYSRFSKDGTMVATSDFDGITKVWNTETGEIISTIGSKKERGVVAGWSKSGDKIFVAPLTKGDLRAYDPKSGALNYAFTGSASIGTVFSDDLTSLVTTPRKNKNLLFQIWDVETGKLVASVPRQKKQGALISIKWSPANQLIATAEGLKKEVKIWNTKGELLQTLSNSTMPMQFSPDGKYMATGGVVAANPKVDTGYLWEFSDSADERLALFR